MQHYNSFLRLFCKEIFLVSHFLFTNLILIFYINCQTIVFYKLLRSLFLSLTQYKIKNQFITYKRIRLGDPHRWLTFAVSYDQRTQWHQVMTQRGQEPTPRLLPPALDLLKHVGPDWKPLHIVSVFNLN